MKNNNRTGAKKRKPTRKQEIRDEDKAKRRRSPRPRCLKGQRHRWIMGAALRASDHGALASDSKRRADHLRGQCRKCGKVRHFHPFAAQSRRAFGAMVAPTKHQARASASDMSDNNGADVEEARGRVA